jgi:hypothetical protein
VCSMQIGSLCWWSLDTMNCNELHFAFEEPEAWSEESVQFSILALKDRKTRWNMVASCTILAPNSKSFWSNWDQVCQQRYSQLALDRNSKCFWGKKATDRSWKMLRRKTVQDAVSFRLLNPLSFVRSPWHCVWHCVWPRKKPSSNTT